MHESLASESPRLLFWRRVREFAVPPSMIESATARRAVGDWAGACAAARVDADLDLRAAARARGGDLAGRLRADLRRLAPDLLRWHMPRVAPDGLLRPGLTVPLARYHPETGGTVHLVARTPPAWASGGQRISLTLWDGPGPCRHPHPRPGRRFRLDLHRHLWDAGRAGELRERSGAEVGTVARWAAEAALLLRADGSAADAVTVRLSAARRLVLRPSPAPSVTTGPPDASRPVLPDAATWLPPDVELLRAGLIDAGRLHPLVAAALVPDHRPEPARPAASAAGRPLTVACRGAEHRIGQVDGALAPLDHDPAELRREELFASLGGTPLPCLRAIDEVTRHPECLPAVRARLDHGDTAGALAAVQDVLGPAAVLRAGALREALRAAARRRVDHGLYRAGLVPLAFPDLRR